MKKVKILALAAVLLGSGAAFATKSPSHKFLTQFANTSLTSTTHWIAQTRLEGMTAGKYTCEDDPKPCTSYFSNSPSSPPADGTAPGVNTVFGIYSVH